MGRASTQCLVAGFLTIARTCRKVLQATPSCMVLGSGNEPQEDLNDPGAFGSVSSRVCKFPGEREQQLVGFARWSLLCGAL